MDSVTKRQAESNIYRTLEQTLIGVGCESPVVAVTLKDSDLAPLQPLIGDYIEVAISGIIRLEDYVKMMAAAG